MFKNLMLTTLAWTVAGLTPVYAQGQSGTNFVVRTQKASWYVAPKELQITDERPVINDFREAPTPPQSIQLPPGPRGGGGAGTPGGGGAQQMGSGGYRNFDQGGPVALPRADFGHMPSNIPMGGIHSSRPLPRGVYTGVHTKTAALAPAASPYAGYRSPSGGGGRKSTPPHAGSYNQSPTTVASYGGYGPSANTQDRSYSSGSVKGKLMTNMLNKVK